MTRYAVVPQPPNLWVGPAHDVFINGAATTWPTANAARLWPFQVTRPVTVSAAYFRVGVASGNMDVGIYSDAGVRLASTGSFAVPTAAITCSQAFTASVRLVPGVRYWAAIAIDNTSAALGAAGLTNRPSITGQVMGGQVATSFPLPSTIVIPTTETTSATHQAVWFA